jgi:hypothetical protein
MQTASFLRSCQSLSFPVYPTYHKFFTHANVLSAVLFQFLLHIQHLTSKYREKTDLTYFTPVTADDKHMAVTDQTRNTEINGITNA